MPKRKLILDVDTGSDDPFAVVEEEAAPTAPATADIITLSIAALAAALVSAKAVSRRKH